jgi:NAD(P)-dependent dehydrogenase (short-subunit alcohol dehydrogenase family)
MGDQMAGLENATKDLSGRKVLITGGSRGLGLALTNALLSRGADVTAVAREEAGLAEAARLGVRTRMGDVTDRDFVHNLVGEVAPSVLILNAGAIPRMAPIDEQDWDGFSAVWNTDVKATLHGVQAALSTPLPQGSRVLVVSSGAALVLGVPFISPENLRLSGGYIGAKRAVWFMAHNANGVAKERGLGIQFQVLLPMQVIGDTNIGREVANAYAVLEGTTPEDHLATRYGPPYSPTMYGEHVADLLIDPKYDAGVAYGFRRGSPIVALDV